VDETASAGQSWYRLKQLNLDGTVHYTGAVLVRPSKGATGGIAAETKRPVILK
jgi:hypothetical protein